MLYTRHHKWLTLDVIYLLSLTSLRLRVVSHTKERIYYHLPEKKKGEERKTREKGERRKECPIEAILNNHSVKLF